MVRAPLRVLIVDDHDIVRVGLCAAVGRRYTVVGAVATGGVALEQAPRMRPDVVIADLRLPDMRGEDLCRRLRAALPGVSVVILSTYLSEETVRHALDAGAASYVTKAAGLPELMKVLGSLQEQPGQELQQSASQIVARLHCLIASRASFVSVTPHQESILELAARGLTNEQISNRLYISESTVRFHLQNLKKKLGARSKTDLIARAIRSGVISPAPEEELVADVHGTG